MGRKPGASVTRQALRQGQSQLAAEYRNCSCNYGGTIASDALPDAAGANLQGGDESGRLYDVDARNGMKSVPSQQVQGGCKSRNESGQCFAKSAVRDTPSSKEDPIGVCRNDRRERER